MQLTQVEHMQSTFFMISEILEAEDEQMFITGVLVLIDLKGFTMGHLTQMPVSLMKKLTKCFEVFLGLDVMYIWVYVDHFCKCFGPY